MNANVLQWDGSPGHYEVYYLTATDPRSGTGLWIRYTMLAPLRGRPASARCGSWRWTATDRALARKATLPDRRARRPSPSRSASRWRAPTSPTAAWAAASTTSRGTSPGSRAPAAEHVHPLLRRARIAKTVLVLPHADVAVAGTVRFAGRELALDGARGGQAHLWGSKHAARWAWAHCGDFADADGAPRPGAFLDGVCVFVPRFGREVGPSTPVVGRFVDEDFAATAPLAVLRAPSRFGLTSWRFEARDGKRRVIGEVDAPRELAGRRHLPRPRRRPGLLLQQRGGLDAPLRLRPHGARAPGWMLRETLVADGRAHFEYAQREPVAGPRAARHVTFRAEGEHLAIDLPGARSLFTTRRGGVSEGPYASLNLGLLTDDDPERVAANRERVRAQAGADRSRRVARSTARRVCRRRRRPARRPTARRRRATDVARDRARRRLPAGGARGRRRAWRCSTRGWRGLAGGVLEEGVRARASRGPVARAPRSGPASAPAATRSATRCARRSATTRRARSTSRPIARGAAARPPASPRSTTRPVHDLRRPALLLPPPRRRRHRPPGGGRVAQLIRGLTRERVADNLARGARRDRPRRERRRSSPPSSTSRSRSCGVLAEAGVTLVGENRAQELERKAARRIRSSTWDFIGHLQSRKVKQVLPLRALDPLGRQRLGARAARPARRRRTPRCSSRSTSPREEGKSGDRARASSTPSSSAVR